MFFITIIQFYPVFIFFIHRGKLDSPAQGGRGRRKRFGVEGFSIIIFCVIMIIFFRFAFFSFFFLFSGKSFMFVRQKSTLKVKFIFLLYQWMRSENVFIRFGWESCEGWRNSGDVNGVGKRKQSRWKNNFLFAFFSFSPARRQQGIWKLRVDSISRNNCFCCAYQKKRASELLFMYFSIFSSLWANGWNKQLAGVELICCSPE